MKRLSVLSVASIILVFANAPFLPQPADGAALAGAFQSTAKWEKGFPKAAGGNATDWDAKVKGTIIPLNAMWTVAKITAYGGKEGEQAAKKDVNLTKEYSATTGVFEATIKNISGSPAHIIVLIELNGPGGQKATVTLLKEKLTP